MFNSHMRVCVLRVHLNANVHRDVRLRVNTVFATGYAVLRCLVASGKRSANKIVTVLVKDVKEKKQ